MDTLPKNHFQLFLNLLRIVGLNFSNEPITVLLKYFGLIQCFNTPFFYTLEGYLEGLGSWGNLEDFLNVFSFLTSRSSAMFQIAIVIWNRKNVIKLIQKMHTGYFQYDPNRGSIEELEIMKKAVRISHFQVYTYLGLCVVLLSVGFSACISLYMKGLRYFPTIQLQFFDLSWSPMFEIALLYTIWSEGMFSLVVGALDSLTSSLLVHIYSQMCILKLSIKTMENRALRSVKLKSSVAPFKLFNVFDEITRTQWIRKELGKIVAHHADIIEFAGDFESSFHLVVFFKLIGCILILCLILYRLSTTPFGPLFCFHLIYYFIMVLQILLYCWWANESMLAGQEIGDEIANLEWIGKEKSYQKTLMMITRQSQKQIRLTVGKFLPLNIETFVSIIYGGFSYFMVLRTFKAEPMDMEIFDLSENGTEVEVV